MYTAVKSDGYVISWDERNVDDKGVVITMLERADLVPLTTGAALDGVIFAAGPKDEANLHAKAYCYDNPNKTAYVCDDAFRVHDEFRQVDVRDERDTLERRAIFSTGLVILLVLNIAVAATFAYFRHGHAVLSFFAMVAGYGGTYAALVQWRGRSASESLNHVLILAAIGWAVVALAFMRA